MDHLKLANKNILLMPLNLLGNHWALLIFDVPNRKTYFLNSLSGECYVEPAKAFSNGLWPLIIEEKELSVVGFIITIVQQQPNLNDCGVYTIQFCLGFLSIIRDWILSDIGSLLSLNQPEFTSITDDVILDLRWKIIRKTSDMEKNVKSDIELKRLEFREFIKNNTSKQQDRFEEDGSGVLKQVEDVDVVTKKTTSIEYESSTHSLKEDNVDASSSSSEISSIDENEISDFEEDALNPIDESPSVETEEPEPVKGMNING